MYHPSNTFDARYLEDTGCNTCYILDILNCRNFFHTPVIFEIWGFVVCDAVGMKQCDWTLPSELLVITYGVKTLKTTLYEGWNFNSGNYLFTTDTKLNTCFEVLLSFSVVTSIVYNPLPAMWKS